MQVPTFHIGLFANTSSAFSVWSRWLFPFLAHGCHPRAFLPLRVEHSTREKRGREVESGHALLRHSITNPFQKCSQVGSPSRPLTKRHRPIDHVGGPWFVLQLFVGSSVFAAAQTTQTNKSREARIRMAFSPFHSATTRFTTFSRLSLGHSFSTTSPVQTKKNLLTPVTLSVETLGTYLLAKVKKNLLKVLKLQPCSNRSYRLETGVMNCLNWVVPFILF